MNPSTKSETNRYYPLIYKSYAPYVFMTFITDGCFMSSKEIKKNPPSFIETNAYLLSEVTV